MTTRTALPPETLAAFGGDELRARVYWEKYSLRGPDGHPTERTPQDMWRRVASGLAAMEPDEPRRASWQQEFYWLLDGFRFLPGGRILHAVGQHAVGRKAAPTNCFVIPLKGDSLPDIYECAKEMAVTYSRGGGVGVDISALRPRGSVVHNAAHESTGAVSFMETFSLVTGTIGMSGRRGALMITIRDSHPDVLDFVRVKRNRDKVRFANISVLVSDAFMRAVEADGPWRLRFENPEARVLVERTINARELWHELIRGARDWAEPGCLFIDTARRLGTTEYNGMHVLTTNPCGEQFLDPYNNCCLGSLNLLTFVRQPFADLQPQDNVNWDALRRAVQASVRFLDNVITYADPLFPLEAQREAARRTRRVGLGITGLGDLLAALRLRYDSDEAIAFADRLMAFIKIAAYRTSVELAKEKGAFPAFDAAQHLAQAFCSALPDDLRADIEAAGLRNAAILTVPPTGSISAMAGVTSGIEPIFALAYLRRSESLSQEYFTVVHPLADAYLRAAGRAVPDLRNAAQPDDLLRSLLPAYFVTAHEIDPLQRVRMQAAIARHVDNSVSTTVNLPRDVSIDTVEQVYRLAWQLGCKGITVYREGSREGVLLTPEEARRRQQLVALADRVTAAATEAVPTLADRNGRAPEEQIEHVVRVLAELARRRPEQLELISQPTGPLRDRPQALEGMTYRIPMDRLGTLFVTINDLDGEPFEVFCRLGKAGADTEADSEALGRLVSFALRLHGPVPRRTRLEALAEQLQGIGGSISIGFGPNRVRSIPDGIAQALRRHLERQAAPEPEPAPAPAPAGTAAAGGAAPRAAEAAPPIAGASNGNICPRCQRYTLVTSEGCSKCGCGYKEC